MPVPETGSMIRPATLFPLARTTADEVCVIHGEAEAATIVRPPTNQIHALSDKLLILF